MTDSIRLIIAGSRDFDEYELLEKEVDKFILSIQDSLGNGVPVEIVSGGARGADRLDPSKGYELGNVVSCCTTCNYLKGTYTEKDFLTLIHKIANNCSVQKAQLP